MRHTTLFLTFVIVTHQFAVAAEFETVISASRPKHEPQAIAISTETERSTPSYPWLSLAQAGVSATPIAGSLSPGDIRLRGFSSPRLHMSVDDFDMSNGGTGLLDLYDLPLFAASQLELIPNATGLAIGGSLRLSLRVPPKPFVRARGSLGSYGYGLTDIVVGTGELGTSRALLAAQLASSRGNYLFANSSSDPQIMPLRRQNNDQTRSFALIKTQHGFSSADLEFFAFVRQHQGGLAGPATFPTPSLRLFSQKALFGTSLSWQIASYPMTLRWESRFDRNETHESELSNFDRTLFMVNSLNLKGEKRFELADTYCSLDTKLWSSQLLDGRYHRLSALFEVAVNTAPFDFWSMRFRRSFSLQLHSDVGWFLGFNSNISATPIKPLTFGIRFSKNSRPPTLSEMFAPQGIVLGNPDLHPEKVYDASLYLDYEPISKLKLNLDVFYAYLARAIFYVNRNSFVVAPINAEGVHRGGIGTSFSYEPNTYFQMTTRVDWLLSYISATAAPLPGATPFASTIEGRIGKEEGIFARLSTIVSGGTTGNLFGTLKTSPYGLFNASLHLPLLNHARLIISATNLADVTWAKNAYHYPMPGREIFITLETFS